MSENFQAFHEYIKKNKNIKEIVKNTAYGLFLRILIGNNGYM